MTNPTNHQINLLPNTKQSFHQLPLPSPELLTIYEQAQTGLINKIIEIVDAESSHRREMEKSKLQTEINSKNKRNKLLKNTQTYVFLASILMIVCGCLVAINGSQINGSIIVIAAVVGTTGILRVLSKACR